MTPKEKAAELAIKFCYVSDVIKPNIGSIRSAIIAVDEIIELLHKIDIGYNMIENIEYYKQVKQELEKL